MKKLFILGIAVFFAFSMNAQRFGVRVGGNFAGMMSTVESKGTKIAPGLQAGIVTEIGPKRINLHLEANYTQKGFNIDLNETIDGVGDVLQEAQVNFSYVEVPVLLKVKIVGPLYVYAGPYFGFALKGNQVTDKYTIDNVDQLTDDIKDINILKISDLNSVPYKKTDFGAAGGLGVQFGLGPIKLFAEGRATLGLSNLYDTEADAWKDLVADGGYKDNDQLKNMVYTVAVGILLGK